MSSELNGSSKNDLGPTLLGQWKARVCLLGLTFELYQYLDSKEFCDLIYLMSISYT